MGEFFCDLSFENPFILHHLHSFAFECSQVEKELHPIEDATQFIDAFDNRTSNSACICACLLFVLFFFLVVRLLYN